MSNLSKPVCLGAAITAAIVSVALPSHVTRERPDVLLVVFDDLYFKVGTWGYAPPTPNLDRLAARGRRFDRAYTQYPLCNPSRASLMFGWRPERTGVWHNDASPRRIAEGAVPLQEYFHASGYRTVRYGKIFHPPYRADFAWDVARDVPYPESDDDEGGYDFDSRVIPTDTRDDEEPDGISARRAAAEIEAGRDQPLFMALGLERPHGPWRVPRRYFEMFPPESVALPSVPKGDWHDIPQIVIKRGAEDVPRGREAEALSAYYASVAFADAQLGVVLDALDRTEAWDHTVVIVTSDHGIQRGEHRLWRKNVLYEESLRVPLIIAAPGLKQPGTASGSLVELIDLYPTLLDLAGLPAPVTLDGTSLTPILGDPDARVKDVALSVSDRGAFLGRSIRTERYRFNLWRPGVMELFDHSTDPDENHNLAADPDQADLVEELTQLVRQLSPVPDPLGEPPRRR